MDKIKKGFSILCAVLFVLTAIPALLLFNLDRYAFTVKTYQLALANEQFYNRFPARLAESLAAYTSQRGNLPVVIQGLSAPDWEAFLRALLPPETLKMFGDQALRSIFDYLNDITDTAQVSLVPLKTSLTSDAGAEAEFTLLSTQPDCTLAQVAQLTIGIIQQGVLQLCNPPAELHGLLTPLIQLQMRAVADFLPEQIMLADQRNPSEQGDPRDRLRSIRLLMHLSPLIPLMLLLLVTILNVRSANSMLTLWGIPLLITGALTALIGFTGAPVISVIMQQILVKNFLSYLPAILLDYAGDLAAAMVNQLLKPIVWQGLVLVVIGLLMTAAARILKRQM